MVDLVKCLPNFFRVAALFSIASGIAIFAVAGGLAYGQLWWLGLAPTLSGLLALLQTPYRTVMGLALVRAGI
jgi:hypothetical protein